MIDQIKVKCPSVMNKVTEGICQVVKKDGRVACEHPLAVTPRWLRKLSMKSCRNPVFQLVRHSIEVGLGLCRAVQFPVLNEFLKNGFRTVLLSACRLFTVHANG